MTLSSDIQKIIDDANRVSVIRNKSQHVFYDNVRDNLARLGFEKATKQELQRIIIRALEQDVE